ncbi:hypothetical protein EJ03DRAFT_221026 [Teratosphaeria nubilosa]|uniref:Secreted protein n=1 Tax=Teratosphaeria nubilosa TaxID=161662 RepID=A0A6G1KX61_9PEZI|nr:hypothetical protein EJ03DRAFT_221026 [Teratosphaeria nubilosa]
MACCCETYTWFVLQLHMLVFAESASCAQENTCLVPKPGQVLKSSRKERVIGSAFEAGLPFLIGSSGLSFLHAGDDLGALPTQSPSPHKCPGVCRVQTRQKCSVPGWYDGRRVPRKLKHRGGCRRPSDGKQFVRS